MNHNEQKWLEQQQAAAELQYGATSWGDFIAAYKYGEATGVKQNEQDEIANVVMQQDQEAVDKYLERARMRELYFGDPNKSPAPKAPEPMKKACVACSHENRLFRSPSSAWVCSACDHFHPGSPEETTEWAQPPGYWGLKKLKVDVEVKVDVDKSLRKQRDAQLRGMFT